jgi:hypothetical protein
MSLQHLLPIFAAFPVSILSGIAPWLDHASIIIFMSRFAFCFCGLLWLIADARSRRIPPGNWTGVITFVFQPIGLLYWFICQWKRRCYIPILIYVVLIFLSSALSMTGYVALGMLHGFSFMKLVEEYW